MPHVPEMFEGPEALQLADDVIFEWALTCGVHFGMHSGFNIGGQAFETVGGELT